MKREDFKKMMLDRLSGISGMTPQGLEEMINKDRLTKNGFEIHLDLMMECYEMGRGDAYEDDKEEVNYPNEEIEIIHCDNPYGMMMFESKAIHNNDIITRVPGGWLYQVVSLDKIVSSSFIPFVHEGTLKNA